MDNYRTGRWWTSKKGAKGTVKKCVKKAVKPGARIGVNGFDGGGKVSAGFKDGPGRRSDLVQPGRWAGGVIIQRRPDGGVMKG